MMINVSTCLASSSMPLSAALIRLAPSKWKGLVTTPTVRTPDSRAALAITGAAPVPVPPPIPAVINTMWLFDRRPMISSMASSAAARPISGLAPAPRPCVRFRPSWIRWSALDISSAWASVFATRNSTPERFERIMLLTAFPPAPPTPTTVIRGLRSISGCGIEIFKLICVSFPLASISNISAQCGEDMVQNLEVLFEPRSQTSKHTIGATNLR